MSSRFAALSACALVVVLFSLPVTAEEPAEEQGPRGLAAVKARGELLWGCDSQGGAPYVFQDPMDPNRLVGFEVDLADAIAKKLGVKARPVQGQWDKLLELLARGDFDVALNGIEVAEEKKRVVALSRPYYAAAERLTVRRDDKDAPHSLAELKDQPVGTLPGSLAERILRREGALVKTYDGGQDEIYADLVLARTRGVLLDDPITRYYGEIQPELQVVPGAFGEVDYAVAFRPEDVDLREAIDAALVQLAKDGTLRTIYERWGLWNKETATLLGDPDPVSHGVPEQWENWRAAVGKLPPFFERVRERYPATIPLFLRGALMTLVVSLLAMALAIVVGVTLATLRTYGPAPLRWLAVAYIEVVRGTPLLVQLTMVYFGLPQIGVLLNPFTAGVLTLGLNYAAAEAENYRAGIGSVPAGQHEAAKVLGLSKWQTLRLIVFPQAIRVSLPPMTNDFIALLKDSSLVSLVTLTELTRTYVNLANAMRDHLGLGAVVAAIYLLIGLPFARLARFAEDRLGRHLKEVPR